RARAVVRNGSLSTPVRSVRAAGYVLMWDWYAETTATSERISAWAFAIRDRAVTLAYSGTAIEHRMPTIATTIISSISVKPRAFHRIDLMAPLTLTTSPVTKRVAARVPSARRSEGTP